MLREAVVASPKLRIIREIMLRLSLPLAEPPLHLLSALSLTGLIVLRGRGGGMAEAAAELPEAVFLFPVTASGELSAVAGSWMVFKEKWPLKTLCASAPMLPMLAGWLGSQGQRENLQDLPWDGRAISLGHPLSFPNCMASAPPSPQPNPPSLSPVEDGSRVLPAPGPLPPVWLPLLFSPHGTAWGLPLHR